MRHGADQINVNGEHVLAVSDKQLQIVGQGIRESTNFFWNSFISSGNAAVCIARPLRRSLINFHGHARDVCVFVVCTTENQTH